MSDSGPPVKWHHFLTGRDDPTIFNVSVLSRPAEWHAAAMGVIAAVFPEVAVVIVGIIVGRQLGRKAVPDLDIPVTLHLKDAAREPVYWGIPFLVVRYAMHLFYGVPVIPEQLLGSVV